jgi:DNA-directed RNA polymerase subunit RPC12/RpoP
MTEGREKTNVKPPYWECKTCNHRAPYYNFEEGMWWWKEIRCPICNSKDIGEATKLKAPPPAPQRPKLSADDRVQLRFIYDRLTNFHLENPRIDYMIRFKEVIDRK